MALAMLILAFCPPEIVIPRSPISVWSPLGRMLKSRGRAQAVMTVLYHSWSKGLAKTMLSAYIVSRIFRMEDIQKILALNSSILDPGILRTITDFVSLSYPDLSGRLSHISCNRGKK